MASKRLGKVEITNRGYTPRPFTSEATKILNAKHLCNGRRSRRKWRPCAKQTSNVDGWCLNCRLVYSYKKQMHRKAVHKKLYAKKTKQKGVSKVVGTA